MSREKLSKRVRFDVFKRDGFTCTYCGQKPPTVVLECDHVVPVAAGGTNATANLTTSCFDCNRGKSDRSLGSVPESVAARAELLAEREEQEKAFAKLLKSRRKRQETQIDEVEVLLMHGSTNVLTDKFRLSVKHFYERLPADRVLFAAERAMQKVHDVNDRCKYFCGICWKIIRDGENAR